MRAACLRWAGGEGLLILSIDSPIAAMHLVIHLFAQRKHSSERGEVGCHVMMTALVYLHSYYVFYWHGRLAYYSTIHYGNCLWW